MRKNLDKKSLKRDYLSGMKPQFLAKKYKITSKQLTDLINRSRWAKEKARINERIADTVVKSEADAIIALKKMERRDMNQLLHYARNMVDPNKPSAFKIKASADVMKIAFERLYKSYGIAEKIESKETQESVITLQWPK